MFVTDPDTNELLYWHDNKPYIGFNYNLYNNNNLTNDNPMFLFNNLVCRIFETCALLYTNNKYFIYFVYNDKIYIYETFNIIKIMSVYVHTFDIYIYLNDGVYYYNKKKYIVKYDIYNNSFRNIIQYDGTNCIVLKNYNGNPLYLNNIDTIGYNMVVINNKMYYPHIDCIYVGKYHDNIIGINQYCQDTIEYNYIYKQCVYGYKYIGYKDIFLSDNKYYDHLYNLWYKYIKLGKYKVYELNKKINIKSSRSII